jgi:hypothetical protein
MQNVAIAELLARYDGSSILPQLLSSEAVASAMMTDLWHRGVAVVSLHGSVSAVGGVCRVKREDGTLPLAAAGRGPLPTGLPSEPARQDITSYMALVRDPSHSEEVEKYLRSKVTLIDGKSTYINQILRRGIVVGWGGLTLDDAARAEVASHPGVINLQKDLNISLD